MPVQKVRNVVSRLAIFEEHQAGTPRVDHQETRNQFIGIENT